MTDPRLLRDGTPRKFDRALLESARDDRAPDGSEERALAALGIGAVAIGAAVVASQGAAAPPAAVAASKIATAVALKWLGIGLAVTIATAAPVTYLVVSGAKTPEAVAPPGSAGGAAPTAPRSTSAAAPTAPPPVAEADETRAIPASALTEAIPEPPAASANGTASPPPRTSAAPARSASSLSPELDVLDRARAALAARDAAGARQALDEYQRRFPAGSLREEAELASIETLVLSGDTTSAHDAALRFLAARPSSTYGGRVRAIAKRTSIP